MNIKRTEKKLIKRIETMEKVSPITNDRELLCALEKIVDEEIASDKPDLALVDKAVNYNLYIKDYDDRKTESETECAKNRFYEKLRESKKVTYAKKNISRSVKLSIAIAAAILLAVGAFASSISFRVADMDGHNIKSLEKNNVYEDGNYTVVISDDMFVYYDSVDEMMEGEELESILLPERKISKIRANTVYYTAEVSKRHIYVFIENDIQICIKENTDDTLQNMNTKSIGNYDVLFIYSNGFMNGIFVSADYEYAIMSSSASEEKISEIIKDLKEYRK